LVYRIPLCVTVSASAAINTCGGANLTATGTGTSYAWSNNATTATTTVATAGTYTVTTTNATGCTGTSTVVVTVAQIGTGLTPQTITGAATALTNTAQIYSVPTTANVAYQWSLPLGGGTIASGTTTNSATINWGATAGSFRVKVVKTLSGSACPSIADSMTVTVTAPPPALRVAYSFNAGNANNDLGTNNNGVPTGATLTIDRFGNANKAYSLSGSASSKIDCGDITFLNNATAFSISGWFKRPAAGVNREMFSKGTALRNRIYLDNAVYGYNTCTNSTGYTTATSLLTMAAQSWFHYAYIMDNGIIKIYVDGVLYGTSPATGNTCNTTASFLLGQYATNTGESWSGLIDDIYIINRVLTQTQIDSLRNAPNPCTVAINITGSTSFCAGGETTLIASGGAAYVWNDGTNTPYNSITAAGTYTVSVATASGCAGSTTIVVTTNAAPTASITGNANFCIYSSATLTATGGTSYAWSTNATTASITTVAQNTFTVTVTNTNGCTATATRATSFLLTPKTTGGGPGITNLLTGNPSAVCAASLFTLGADFIQTASPTYLWSTGSTGNGIAVTLNTTTTYTVTITNSNGCTATGQRTITSIPLPTPTIASGGNVLSCGTFTTYQWFLNGAPIATTATFTATQSGNYEVRVINADGCVGTSPVFNHTFVGTENSAFQSSVSILPNPVHDILFIKTSNTDLATLEISDIMGRKVEQINHNIPNSIDLSDLQNGVYFVRIADNAGNSFTQKIIKQ
jgi:Concanavalin A-like lectin/glucanases superfamily/Secretion system C-terminal sorting domain/PKD-like domain